MKMFTPPPHALFRWQNRIKLVFMVLFMVISISKFNSQTATTFTCTKANVSDSLISQGVLIGDGIITNDTLHAKDAVIFDQSLDIQGNIMLAGNLLFDNATNTVGMAKIPTSTLSPNGGLLFAETTGTAVVLPQFPNPCLTAVALPQFSFGGRIQAFDGTNNLTLDMGSDNTNNFIDSRGGNSNTGHLKVNYYCGKDILLGTNTAFQTKVFTGDYVEMRKHAQLGTITAPITDINNTALQIFANAGNGITLSTNNNSLVAVRVNNFTGNTFTLYGDGRLYVGLKKIQSNHVHANSPYQFDGKVACRELVVVDPIKWADFVFDEDYKLTPLKDVEAYYIKNKHLKDVPTEKDVKENGINVAEMYAILLQKIEEQTLYNVELNKRIEKLEAENKKLKRDN